MEIKYVRTYAPKGKRYTVGTMSAALGYAMEIIEPRPQLSEGRIEPGHMCMFLFAITPEEYALREDDPKAMDALSEKLVKAMPADRMLAWAVRDLKGANIKAQIKPKMGESIDGGELQRRVLETQRRVLETQRRMLAGPIDDQLLECRRLQHLCGDKEAPEGVRADWKSAREALGRSVSELESLYAAYDLQLGERWPAVGFDGRVEIFTTRLRAENAAAQIQKANAGVKIWSIREIQGSEMEIFFKKLENDGLLDLRIDNGFAAAELSLKDFRKATGAENANLRSLILREIAYGMRFNALKQAEAPEKNRVGALESVLSLRNFVWHTVGRSILYAACDVPAGGDRLCTSAVYALLQDKSAYRPVGGERCISLKNKQTQQNLLAAFTTPVQAVAFCERIGSGARPVAMTYDDLVKRASTCDGVVIDPDAFAYRIQKQDFAKPVEMRTKPLTVVKIKQEEVQQPQIRQPENSGSLGSLPNPDAEEMPSEEKSVQQETEEQKSDSPSKGIFRRFFKK